LIEKRAKGSRQDESNTDKKKDCLLTPETLQMGEDEDDGDDDE
jgi:hypothetical protein